MELSLSKMLKSSHGKLDILHIPQNHNRGNFRQVNKLWHTHTNVHREQADKILYAQNTHHAFLQSWKIFLQLSVVLEENAKPCVTLTKLSYHTLSFVGLVRKCLTTLRYLHNSEEKCNYQCYSNIHTFIYKKKLHISKQHREIHSAFEC
jgi:hypothetical protein